MIGKPSVRPRREARPAENGLDTYMNAVQGIDERMRGLMNFLEELRSNPLGLEGAPRLLSRGGDRILRCCVKCPEVPVAILNHWECSTYPPTSGGVGRSRDCRRIGGGEGHQYSWSLVRDARKGREKRKHSPESVCIPDLLAPDLTGLCLGWTAAHNIHGASLGASYT